MIPQFLTTFWRPVLEILIIWAVVYSMLRLIQGTRAVQLLAGLLIFALVFQMAKFLGLDTISWVFTKLFAFGMIAFLILFQPELRRALARIGQTTLWRGFLQKGGLFDEVINACEAMSRSRVGALIAIEREVGLKNYIETGVPVDSAISEELIRTVFTKSTPLHDGAMIIQGSRMASCGSLLPLTQNPQISKAMGTRHRAAIGLTEETDAVVIVISEETGSISVSVYGKLTQNLDGEALRRVLRSLFVPEEPKGVAYNLLRGFKFNLSKSEKLDS